MSIVSRLAGLLRRTTGARPVTPTEAAPPAVDRWADQFRDPTAAASWVATRLRGGRLYADLPRTRVTALRDQSPRVVASLLQQADRIIRHEFDLLGSGPYNPIDPVRQRVGDYVPIDWALDPVSGLRFPEGFPYSTWNMTTMRPGLADIKLPWELGRCQHWVTLGQAFRVTGDERYATEIVREHADFLTVNPIGTGVQYTCTMDVAIRAVNWAIAFELIRESASFPSVANDAYRSLFELGIFIEGNLENKYEVTSNHFLSNVAGVYALGLVFQDLPVGQRWLRQGRDWFEQEMRVQVLPDGGDYESSVPYHRLVAELFLSGARIAQLEGSELSESYLASLRRMIDLVAVVSRPDGVLPQIGDADDGRLHIFTGYGEWKPQDGRHLFGAAACVFRDPSWLSHDATSAWEAAWWGLEAISVADTPSRPWTGSKLFPESGLAVVRTSDAYLIVTNGRVGTNGFGNHKHNDLLGFEFHAGGDPLLVDPGSYVYTSNPDARNAFRQTGSHNTLMADGVEQNDLKPEYLFRLFETSTVEHVRLEETADRFEYAGRHTGYARLPNPVMHERSFQLVKASSGLTIVDRLDGAGDHRFTWHFRAAPGVSVDTTGDGSCVLVAAHARWRLRGDSTLGVAIVDAWYSPSYGVRVPCRAIDFSVSHRLAGPRDYQFVLERIQ